MSKLLLSWLKLKRGLKKTINSLKKRRKKAKQSWVQDQWSFSETLSYVIDMENNKKEGFLMLIISHGGYLVTFYTKSGNNGV